jgi:hypothetical protein
MNRSRLKAARRLASLVLVGSVLVGTLGMSSANAAVSLPPHQQSLVCNFGNPGRLDWSWWSQSFYGQETLWAYPVLYRAVPGGRYFQVSSTITDRYWTDFALTPNHWEGGTIFTKADPGYYYAVQTYYYWPKLGYGQWEWSNSCFMQGGIGIVVN